MFSAIANTGIIPSMPFVLDSKVSLNSDIVSFDTTRFPRDVLVEPVREERILDIVWPLISMCHKFRMKASSILSHLVWTRRPQFYIEPFESKTMGQGSERWSYSIIRICVQDRSRSAVQLFVHQ